MVEPIIVNDGQTQWAADWPKLKAAMLAAGWDVYGHGYNARAIEPGEGSPEAYGDLCCQVASVGGEGSDEEIPDTEASMTYAPAEGHGVWILWGVSTND